MTERASFVQQPYRFDTASNLSLKATYPAARELVHNSNLVGDQDTLASKLLEEGGIVSAFKVVVEGRIKLADMEGSPLRFVLDAARYQTDGRTSKVTAFDIDHMADRTTFEIRG